MNLNTNIWNRVEFLATSIRLAILLTLPGASLATEGRSPIFFALIMVTNLLGVASGVILFKFRRTQQFVTPLSIGTHTSVRKRPQIKKAA